MGKKLHDIFIVILCVIFFFSVAAFLRILYEYRKIDTIYEKVALQFTTMAEDKSTFQEIGESKADVESTSKEIGEDETAVGSVFRETGKDETNAENASEANPADAAPITVDFATLQSINEDVVGWIYCEGTTINYPVLQGEDNEFYLDHMYDKTVNRAGSIFIEANNRKNFDDSNTIIYGHHMKNGAMFATLNKWSEQEYYEKHPIFWLLTPKRNYQIVLFSSYRTAVDSDTYTIYQGTSREFEDYLQAVSTNSDFSANVELDANRKFVVLSTCEYTFENARYVLHGMLVPCETEQNK